MASRNPGSVFVHEDTPPLYVIEFRGVPTDAQFRAYLDRTLELTKRGEVHAMVFDATHVGLIPPAQRKMQADWMREHDELNRDLTAACAFVLPNALLRGMLTAILWLHPMPCPYGVFATREEAVGFCKTQLRERGIPLRTVPPPSVTGL